MGQIIQHTKPDPAPDDFLAELANTMPEICRFYGIVIRMFLIDREHPPPHIHIKYGDHQAVMELKNLNLIDGHLPRKCRQLVREWGELHQDELIDMWTTQDFHPIQPLE